MVHRYFLSLSLSRRFDTIFARVQVKSLRQTTWPNLGEGRGGGSTYSLVVKKY